MNSIAEFASDDRVLCSTCTRRCKGVERPRRCVDYAPNAKQADARNGATRWPMLLPTEVKGETRHG